MSEDPSSCHPFLQRHRSLRRLHCMTAVLVLGMLICFYEQCKLSSRALELLSINPISQPPVQSDARRQRRRSKSNQRHLHQASSSSTTNSINKWLKNLHLANPTFSHQQEITTPLAWKVVTTAFSETYIHLQQCCETKTREWMKERGGKQSKQDDDDDKQQGDDVDEGTASSKAIPISNEWRQRVLIDCIVDTRAATGAWPWWFQTLLRDASPQSLLHHRYHFLWMRLNQDDDGDLGTEKEEGNRQKRSKGKKKKTWNGQVSSSSSSSMSLLQFCAIEKVSSRQWESLQCQLNYNVSNHKEARAQGHDNENPGFETVGGGEGCSLQLTPDQAQDYLSTVPTKDTTASSQARILYGQQMPRTSINQNPQTHKAVFLRDPLERFLSAFVDKCIGSDRRLGEHHCEPNVIFGVPKKRLCMFEHEAAGRKTPQDREKFDVYSRGRTLTTDLVVPQPLPEERAVTTDDTTADDLQVYNRYLFEAYVDVFPLSWNVHFYPQAMYCNGLFQDMLTEYDFVGTLYMNLYGCPQPKTHVWSSVGTVLLWVAMVRT